MLPILVVLLVVVLTARMILKGYKSEPVLLMAGLILMTSTWMFGWGEVLPGKVTPTGILALDPFQLIQYFFSYRLAGLGLMIMSLVGFASYMSHIGANDVIVSVSTKPLSKIKNKSILLFVSYIVACTLQLAIPSATGLGVLLMVTLFPVLIGLGISAGSAAAIIASSLAVSFTPTGIDAIRASEAIGMPLIEYVVNFQAPTSVTAMLAIGIAHIFWQARCDKKEGFDSSKVTSQKSSEVETLKAPTFYALLPMLPIIMAVLCSKLVFSEIKINVTTIALLSMFIAMICELFRTRDLKEVFAGFSVFLKGMGNAFTTVVGLLVAAGVFAHGIKVSGAITDLILMANDAGLPAVIMTVIFALVTMIAAIIMGSGNAPFLAFVELIPQIAASMGVSATTMIMPMQQASAMGRAMSPVSAVVIAVSTEANLKPFDVVKRTAVPVLVGFVVHITIVTLFF